MKTGQQLAVLMFPRYDDDVFDRFLVQLKKIHFHTKFGLTIILRIFRRHLYFVFFF